MPDETKSEPVPSIPTTEGGVNEAQLDPIGQNILDALHKATGLARWNSRYAVDIAQKLSDQLCAAEIFPLLLPTPEMMPPAARIALDDFSLMECSWALLQPRRLSPSCPIGGGLKLRFSR